MASVVALYSRTYTCRAGAKDCVRLFSAFTIPAPYCASGPGVPTSTAYVVSSDRSCVAVRPGFCASRRAATPDTCGVAIDVPIACAYVGTPALKSHIVDATKEV